MGRMKELYEQLWFDFVEQGMSPDEIAEKHHVPVSWVHGALDTAEIDDHYDQVESRPIQ